MLWEMGIGALLQSPFRPRGDYRYMEHPASPIGLYFVSWQLALRYLLLCFLSAVGVLQLVAAYRRYVGFSLLGKYQRPWGGYALGIALIAIPYAIFFSTSPGIFRPGPAGSELTVLFSIGAFLALLFTLTGASLVQKIEQRQQQRPREQPPLLTYEPVELQLLRGMLYRAQEEQGASRGAICLLPDLTALNDDAGITALIQALTQAGFHVLTADWNGVQYPEVLGVVPTSIAALTRRTEVDAEHIGVLGIRLGGNLALRSAAEDPTIRTVVALAPLLGQESAQPGLELLRELSYWQAWRWGNVPGQEQLVKDLAAQQWEKDLPPRPWCVVVGAEDTLVPIAEIAPQVKASGGEIEVVPRAGHFNLLAHPLVAESVVGWFGRHLAS